MNTHDSSAQSPFTNPQPDQLPTPTLSILDHDFLNGFNDDLPPLFTLTPPLLNSASPWATTYDDLRALYDNPHTGAVTIRTSSLLPTIQSPSTHQYTFFSSSRGHSDDVPLTTTHREGQPAPPLPAAAHSSLNNLEYSPIPFDDYARLLINMAQTGYLTRQPPKPFIVSIAGSPAAVTACAERLLRILNEPDTYQWSPGSDYTDLELMMEVNLSCPNVAGRSPPAYDGPALAAYLAALAAVKERARREWGFAKELLVGLKTPPYTYAEQFDMLVGALDASMFLEGGCPVAWVSATNTLGNCCLFDAQGRETLGGGKEDGRGGERGMGGLGGDALHPLALGNVKCIRAGLDASIWREVRRIVVIGIGGVRDADGVKRMRNVGAAAVGVGTALGREGIEVFAKIAEGLKEKESPQEVG